MFLSIDRFAMFNGISDVRILLLIISVQLKFLLRIFAVLGSS